MWSRATGSCIRFSWNTLIAWKLQLPSSRLLPETRTKLRTFISTSEIGKQTHYVYTTVDTLTSGSTKIDLWGLLYVHVSAREEHNPAYGKNKKSLKILNTM